MLHNNQNDAVNKYELLSKTKSILVSFFAFQVYLFSILQIQVYLMMIIDLNLILYNFDQLLKIEMHVIEYPLQALVMEKQKLLSQQTCSIEDKLTKSKELNLINNKKNRIEIKLTNVTAPLFRMSRS